MSSTTHSSLVRTLGLAAVLAEAVSGSSCYSSASALAVMQFESLTIQAATASSPGSCLASGTGEAFGIMDVARPGCCGFSAGVELVNDLPTQEDSLSPPLTVNQHDVTISSVTVSYTFTPSSGSPNVVLRSENLPMTAVIPSGQGTATVITPVLSASNGALLAPAGGTPATGGIVAKLTYNGTTRDGTVITSTPITFPITVCKDCLPKLTCMNGTTTCTPDSMDQADGAICN
jgi:hypothetical protein